MLLVLSYLFPTTSFVIAAILAAYHMRRADRLQAQYKEDALRKKQLAADVVHLARHLRWHRKRSTSSWKDWIADAILDEIAVIEAQCRSEGDGGSECIAKVLAGLAPNRKRLD